MAARSRPEFCEVIVVAVPGTGVKKPSIGAEVWGKALAGGTTSVKE